MKPVNLHLGFSSIGCPDFTLEEALVLTEQYDLGYVELRSLGGTTNLPNYLSDIAPPGSNRPQIRLLGTSFCLLKTSGQSEKEFYSFAELANRMRTPYLRVFGMGGNQLGAFPDELSLGNAIKTIQRVRAHLRETGCKAEILLETHDVFSSSDRCLALNSCLDRPVKLLWDSFHTWNLGREDPRDTWDKIGHWIEHIHYNDSSNSPGSLSPNYVPAGQGKYPSRELRDLLQREEYRGGLSLEWEKLWHPELASLEDVLAGFVALFREFHH